MKRLTAQPLTFWGSLAGIWWLWLEKTVRPSVPALSDTVGEYRLQKLLKSASDDIMYTVGLYRHLKTHQDVIIKSVPFHYAHLLYRLLNNEAHMLQLLGKSAITKTVVIPKVLDIFEEKGHLHLVREYVTSSGQYKSSAQLVAAFTTCVTGFQNLSPRSISSLPKRSVVHTAWWLPVYACLAVLRSPGLLLQVVPLVVQFYRHLSWPDLRTTELSLCHRDLTPQNIIKVGDQPGLIDLETMAVGERLTDTALFPRFFYRTLALPEIMTYIAQQLHTPAERRSFIRLNIFYCLQFLAGESPSSPFHAEARQFLPLLTNELLPAFGQTPISLYERLRHFVLRLCQPLATSPKQPVIVCYHDVSESPWRFSTTPQQLREHLRWYQQHYEVVPLTQLLASPPTEPGAKPKLALTFDDGYQSLVTTAAPILAQKQLPATVFVIGNQADANRAELQNELPLLSLKELKSLQKSGWTIGFHTETHADLAAATKSDLVKEIKTGKATLEKALGTPITLFAYPRGMANTAIVQVVQDAGYAAAFTVDGGATKLNSPWLINRVPLEGDVPVSELAVQLSSLGLYIESCLLWVLHVKANLARFLRGDRLQ